MSNKSDGNTFESQFARALHQNGYWVHLLADRKNGQPFDVIAVKNNISYAFDCKSCMNGYFALSRIEDNQELAMDAWLDAGNSMPMFALKFKDSIKVIGYGSLKLVRSAGAKRIREEDFTDATTIELLGDDYHERCDWK